MSRKRWISLLFAVAAIYDGILGVVFLVAPLVPFDRFGVPPPNHVGYVQFPAALLLVFAAMFASIARDPVGRRSLIPYGIGVKVSYCVVAGGHWLAGGVPFLWKPFVLADLAMLVLFAAAIASLRALGPTARA